MSSGSSTFTTGSFGDKHPKTYKDSDNDGLLSDRELLFACDQIADAHFDLSDIHGLMSSLGMDLNGDGRLDKSELAAGPDGSKVGKYLSQLLKASPQKRSRLSDLAWIGSKHTPLAVTLRKRLETVMALPASVAALSERMQVVRYTSGGQYTAHLDSGAAPQPRSKKVGAMPCCHLAKEEERQLKSAGGESDKQFRPAHDCRLCRFATMLYNLNDLGDGGGGETVFPLAEDAKLTKLDAAAVAASHKARPSPLARGQLVAAVDGWRVHGAREEEYCRSSRGGARGGGVGLRVTPKKGQAILWYNHHVQPTDNSESSSGIRHFHVSRFLEACADGLADVSALGNMDFLSLHGGCRVMEGREKWIANHWVEASEDLEQDEQAASRL
jgi:hypothetical protein